MQYVVVGVMARFGMPLLDGVFGAAKTRKMTNAMYTMMVNKFVFTDLLPAGPPFLSETFGAVEGSVCYSQDGQAWLNQGGQWAAMQGAIVEATPLDGAIVEATPLDGYEEYTNRDYNVGDAYRRAYQSDSYY